MGQLCSRPRTVEELPAGTGSNQQARSVGQQNTSFSSLNGDVGEKQTHHILLDTPRSEAELSELDVVVQQLHDNHNSVIGSAPELLQQWDHDHRVVLDSIDAAIQVQLWYIACFCFDLLP